MNLLCRIGLHDRKVELRTIPNFEGGFDVIASADCRRCPDTLRITPTAEELEVDRRNHPYYPGEALDPEPIHSRSSEEDR